jgi:Mg-chelatase subunit ChlD
MSASAFIKAFDSMALNRGFTENGANCHLSTESPLLDLFFEAVRDLSDAQLDTLITAVISTHDKASILHLFVMCFQTRDCRGGKGERTLAFKFFVRLFDTYPEVCLATVHLFPEFGSWKDMLQLLTLTTNDMLQNKVLDLYSTQLKADYTEATKPVDAASAVPYHPKLSLAAKYSPSEGKEFATAHPDLFKKFLEKLFPKCPSEKGLQQRLYRKMKTAINAKLATIEVMMCDDRFEDINMSSVPSVAMKKYRKAFLNEDLKSGEIRHPDNEGRMAARDNLLEAAASTDPKKSIKGGQLTPADIAKQFMRPEYSGSAQRLSDAEKQVLFAQWDDMRSKVAGKGRPVVPVADVSGSMAGVPMENAVALSILLSEVTIDAFRDRVITFHEKPTWVDLSKATTLEQKVHTVQAAPWGMSTNMHAVFLLIVDVVRKNRLTADQVPDLAIFTDMQFDTAFGAGHMTHLELVTKMFHDLGMELHGVPMERPRITFWNLRATTGAPATGNAKNVMMLSGFSQSLLKYVLEDTPFEPDPTPLETMMKVLNDERYNIVREIVSPLL